MKNTKLQMIDTLIQCQKKINNKVSNKLEVWKQKEAIKLFEKNNYINNYCKNFYKNFENTFIDDTGFLCRFNSFDFTQIDNSLKENLKNYLECKEGLYYYKDDFQEGFTISSFDNIYIDKHNNSIYADFIKKSINYSTKSELELFLKLEKIQSNNGIYPDIIYLDYYGNYDSDYKMPDLYKFLKTGMENNEKKLLFIINELINLYDKEFNNYDDNYIIENFTPDFIKKMSNHLSIDIYNVELKDDFQLHITYEIPTILRENGMKKLNIQNYNYTSYKTTIINIDTNIQEFLTQFLK